MYQPAHFEEHRSEVLHALVASQPLCTLVTLNAEGLVADQIPLLLRADQGPHGTLVGHVARANPLWSASLLDRPVLAIFQGPQHYISPNWYPGKQEHGKVVPTWNYVVVQAKGLLQIHDDVAWMRALVTQLTAQQEAHTAASAPAGSATRPWTLEDAPPAYIDSMLKAIVGISIEVTQWSGKWKLSQNQTAVNRGGVVDGLGQSPDAQAQAMAALMQGR